MHLHSIGLLPTFSAEEYDLVTKIFRENLGGASKNAPANVEAANKFSELLKKKIAPATSSNSEIFLTDSARSAFALLLQTLNFASEDEVILPAFTCVVIVNPVLSAGVKPIFCDINSEDFNTPVEGLLKLVTTRTKAILVQHTFGKTISVSELKAGLKKLKRDDILIIEDLAHSFGSAYSSSEQALTGSLADFSLLTFGYEKVISTIRGGALFVNAKYKNSELLQRLVKSYSELPELPEKYIKRLLINPIFWRIAARSYYFGFGPITLGKFLVKIARVTGVLGIAISPEEYEGKLPEFLPAKFPNLLAPLGLVQLRKLEYFQNVRKKVASAYGSNYPLPLLRFSLLLKNSEERLEVLKEAKKHRIILGDWYKTMFFTKPEFLANLGYKPGSCPVTEDVCSRIINFPTDVSLRADQLVVLKEILKRYNK